MNKNTICLILLIFTFTFGNFAKVEAQELIIEPGQGFVNEIIKADTAAGKQAHNVYVFHRGATYIFNGTIKNVGYPITLKAEEGTGSLPMLINYPDGAAKLQKFIQSADNAYLYNLFIDGMGPDLNTLEPDPLYLMNGQLLNAGASGKEFIIDGCILSNAGQTIIRSSSGARKVQITNTIIANSGQLVSDNLGNGRIIDIRNGITDTLIFRNCTLINTYDRLIRHYGAAANSTTAYIDYLEFDHNTVVHNTGAYGFIFLGDISGSVKITNNLFLNPMALGVDTADMQRFAEVQIIGEVGADGYPVFPLIIDQPNTSYSPTYEMKNNVIAYDETVKNYMSTNNVQKAPALIPRLESQVGANPFVEADVTLANIPNVMIEVMNWYRPLAITALAGGMITTAEFDMDRRSREFWADSIDCSYETSNTAFLGTDGTPVGSAVWDSKVNTTGIKDVDQLPTEFALSNNYPNPFNPSTTISFNLPENAKVSLKVFNLLGQEVAKVIEGEYTAGSHSANFNAAALSSGVYIYSITVTGKNGHNFVASNKMTLLK